ncbi:MAG: hypothetical protein HYV28_20115 [Ignavibacteriales bacterium]|nr:hypothetical protein [Ignavibacteriales bacterium]
MKIKKPIKPKLRVPVPQKPPKTEAPKNAYKRSDNKKAVREGTHTAKP